MYQVRSDLLKSCSPWVNINNLMNILPDFFFYKVTIIHLTAQKFMHIDLYCCTVVL